MITLAEELIVLLNSLLGQQVVGVERIHYTHHGQVTRDTGPLQVTTSSSDSLLLSGGGDGASLRVERGPWVDPFAGELSPENEEYVERSGNFDIFDAAEDPKYGRLVGGIIGAICPIRDEVGLLRGLEIVVDDHLLHFLVEWDEDFVTVDDGGELVRSMRFHVERGTPPSFGIRLT